jgi:hypothetical protein
MILNESGGGLNLSLLYSTLLDFVGDNGGINLGMGLQVVGVPLANQFPRMEQLYRRHGEAAVAACVTDALEHLAGRGILKPFRGCWVRGPAFKFGTPMTILPGRRRDARPAIRHTVVSREERERLAAADHRKQAITDAAAELREGGRGLRPIDEQHVQALVRSVEEFGLRDDLFPVRQDQHGRILSGRHRLEVARRLGRPWRRLTIRVRNDDEALAIAWAANSAKPWAAADRARLAKWGIIPERTLGTKAKREVIREALLADPGRRNSQIAVPLGVDYHTVQAVRAELQEKQEIPIYEFGRGRPRSGQSAEPIEGAAGASRTRRALPDDWPRTSWGPAKLHLSHDPDVAARQLARFPRGYVLEWLDDLRRLLEEMG